MQISTLISFLKTEIRDVKRGVLMGNKKVSAIPPQREQSKDMLTSYESTQNWEQ